jgi:hypothetical protein
LILPPRESSSKAVFLEKKRRKMHVFVLHREKKATTFPAQRQQKSPTRAPGFSLISTALIIRVGGKLLCQLLKTFIWIVLNELDDFSGLEGLDTAILPGNSQKEFSIMQLPCISGADSSKGVIY